MPSRSSTSSTRSIPTTGAIVNSAPDNAQGLNEQDMAYANGLLIVSDTNGLAYEGGTNVLDEYDPEHARLRSAGAGRPYTASSPAWPATVWAASTATGTQFNVNAGDNLVITTTTPGDRSGNGCQFSNDLDPTINLYDASGNLVATATGNASDGSNDVIDWTALTSGSYRVQIIGASQDQPGRVHDRHPGRHRRRSPVHGDLDQPGRRIGFRLPGLEHDRQLQQQRAALEP